MIQLGLNIFLKNADENFVVCIFFFWLLKGYPSINVCITCLNVFASPKNILLNMIILMNLKILIFVNSVTGLVYQIFVLHLVTRV